MSYEAGGAADAAKTTSWRGALMSGVLTNVLNPKALLFCSVLLPQFVSPASGPVGRQFAVLGVILVSLGLAFDVLCALAGGAMGRWLSASPKAQKIQSLVFGTALIGFGLRLTLAERPAIAAPVRASGWRHAASARIQRQVAVLGFVDEARRVAAQLLQRHPLGQLQRLALEQRR